jgi:hypothetical protein
VTAKQLARRGDPETSKLAAASILDSLTSLQERALALVRENPGRIARELSTIAMDSDPRTVNRRLGELERAGRIRKGEAARCRTTNRMCSTWWVAGE